MRALFTQPVQKLDEISSGTVANTITSNSNTIQVSVSDRLHTLFQALALIIAAYAIAFRYSWALTLATSAGILFICIVYGITTPFVLKAQQAVEKSDAKHATVVSEVMSSIRTVFALGAQGRLTEKHSKFINESHRNGLRLAPWMGMNFGPIFFAIYACYALAFWFGLKLYREGNIRDVGTVIMYVVLLLLGTSNNIQCVLQCVDRHICHG